MKNIVQSKRKEKPHVRDQDSANGEIPSHFGRLLEERMVYQRVMGLTSGRYHGRGPYASEERLPYLTEEVTQRINAKRIQVFMIGELLTEIKQIIGHGNFKKYVEENFIFSYETAKSGVWGRATARK